MENIINTLKLNWAGKLICFTDKGPLTLQTTKDGDTAYHLDAVRLGEDKQKELKALLG